MKNIVAFLFGIILFLTAGCEFVAAAEKTPVDGEICLITSAKDVPRMPVEELKSRLKDPLLILIDIRASGDWNESSKKIPGAFRETNEKVEEWASKYDKNKAIVLYCAGPSEGTSARVALTLFKKGFNKVFALRGGWDAWEKAGYPVEPKGYDLPVTPVEELTHLIIMVNHIKQAIRNDGKVLRLGMG